MATQGRKDAWRRLVQLLHPHEMKVDAELRFETNPRRTYVLLCVEKAVEYIEKHPNLSGLQLVHGRVSFGRLRETNHTWVELPGNIVFDGVAQRFYNRLDYYRTLNVEVVRLLTAEETLKIPFTAQCQRCGKEYLPRSRYSASKFCSNCRRIKSRQSSGTKRKR